MGMGLGAALMTAAGHLNQELPRYLYQRLRWARQGIHEGSLRYVLEMQKEILVQCLCDMGMLCLPLMVQAYGPLRGPLTPLEGPGGSHGWPRSSLSTRQTSR